MGTVFDNHISSTFFADYIGYLILNFNCFQLFFCFFNRFFQIRIEIADNRFPLYLSFCDHIQKSFHISGKVDINNACERLLHNIIDHFTKFCHIKILVLFCNVSSCNDRRDCWCIGTRTSDSKFFQCLYKRCLGVMCRWLCEMLLIVKGFFRQF